MSVNRAPSPGTGFIPQISQKGKTPEGGNFTMIKNFIPRLAERGRIKIGEKGEMKTSSQGKQFAQPKKLDHMLITTMQRVRREVV